MQGSAPRVAHVLNVFLPTSQTFIHTQLLAQSELTQAVFARRRTNTASFPFGPVTVDSLSQQADRVLRRLPDTARRVDPFPYRLARRMRAYRPDVLHAHFGWSGVPALQVASRLKLPLIVAFHGRDVYSPRSRQGGAHGYYDELLGADALFTCVGPRAGDALVAYGFPRERVRLVPVGLDLDDFPFTPAPIRSPVIVLQVGRLVDKKGVDTSLRAFAIARGRLGPAELWIVGDGPARHNLEALASELGVTPDVRFYGSCTPTKVHELMSQAHFGLQPSRIASDGDREGTPTVLLEMQARGIGVCATRHADIPFIVPDATSLVEENDAQALAMELVSRSSMTVDARHRWLAAGRALIERQHDAQMIKLTLRALYDEAIAQARSRAQSSPDRLSLSERLRRQN